MIRANAGRHREASPPRDVNGVNEAERAVTIPGLVPVNLRDGVVVVDSASRNPRSNAYGGLVRGVTRPVGCMVLVPRETVLSSGSEVTHLRTHKVNLVCVISADITVV